MEVRYVTDRHDTLCANTDRNTGIIPIICTAGWRIWTWRRRIRF